MLVLLAGLHLAVDTRSLASALQHVVVTAPQNAAGLDDWT